MLTLLSTLGGIAMTALGLSAFVAGVLASLCWTRRLLTSSGEIFTSIPEFRTALEDLTNDRSLTEISNDQDLGMALLLGSVLFMLVSGVMAFVYTFALGMFSVYLVCGVAALWQRVGNRIADYNQPQPKVWRRSPDYAYAYAS